MVKFPVEAMSLKGKLNKPISWTATLPEMRFEKIIYFTFMFAARSNRGFTCDFESHLKDLRTVNATVVDSIPTWKIGATSSSSAVMLCSATWHWTPSLFSLYRTDFLTLGSPCLGSTTAMVQSRLCHDFLAFPCSDIQYWKC